MKILAIAVKPRRLISLCLLCCLVLLTSCGKEHQNGQNIMRAAAITVPGTPWFEGWQILKARLAQQPGEKIIPILYVTGQLGSEESTLSQLRRGRVQMGGFSLQGASSVVPELGLLMAPYLFSSLEEVDFVMDNYASPALGELFAKQDIVLLSWAEVGWTYIYGKEPIITPEDAQGLKLRSSYALSSQLLITGIGGNMVPMPFSDLMPSLQTGLIEGGESGSLFYALAGMGKEAPHLTMTRHAYDSGMFIANKQWFNALSKQQQDALTNSLPTLAELRNSVRNAEKTLLADPAKRNIILHELNEEQKQLWVEATRKNHQILIDKIGGDAQRIYDIIMKGKADFAALKTQNTN